MTIVGIEGMNGQELELELQRGARFVVFYYCISALVVSFRQASDIYFIRADENAVMRGLGFSLVSMLLGWWGIPWGPIYTISSFVTNFSGGQDITDEVIAGLAQQG